MTRNQITIILALSLLAFLSLICVSSMAHAGCIITDGVPHDCIDSSVLIMNEDTSDDKLIVKYKIERKGSVLDESYRCIKNVNQENGQCN